MEEITVYHVVTESPIQQGQRIIFDEAHHNGGYDRVMMFQRLL